jgi:hypothetical protein
MDAVPVEILSKIVALSDIKTAARCRTTTKSLKEAVDMNRDLAWGLKFAATFDDEAEMEERYTWKKLYIRGLGKFLAQKVLQEYSIEVIKPVQLTDDEAWS